MIESACCTTGGPESESLEPMYNVGRGSACLSAKHWSRVQGVSLE